MAVRPKPLRSAFVQKGSHPALTRQKPRESGELPSQLRDRATLHRARPFGIHVARASETFAVPPEDRDWAKARN